jgi:hypothetical protein
MGKPSVANAPQTSDEGNDYGLAYDVETTCGKAVQVLSEALAYEREVSPLAAAALEQLRSDLTRLTQRAVREQRAAK